MPSELTPEEKLLKLIKEGRPNTESKSALSSVVDDPAQDKLPSLSMSPAKRKKQRPEIRKASFISFFLWFAIFLLCLGLCYQLVSQKAILSVPQFKKPVLETFSIPATPSDSSDSYENYQKVFEGRNIFKTIGEPPPMITVERSASFSELTRNLYLSGIIDGEKPQAIIEDRSNGQIHYVESGDFIGSIQVISVGSDHVILRYGDEEGQLTL
jgi:hypothetical protein